MARRNPKIIELEENLRKANLRADNAEELHHRAQGKLEKYEEEEERRKEERHMLVREREEYTRQLESEVAWMRRLVEFLCIPADKLEAIQKFKEEIHIEGRPYPGRNY